LRIGIAYRPDPALVVSRENRWHQAVIQPMFLPMTIRIPILVLGLAAHASGEIEFNRDIRPILTAQCTGCHGGVKEAGGISFVFRDKALAIGESGNPTIVPGNPDASELMRRVTSSEPDLVMPHPDHGPPLPPEEIAKLRQWIAEGAEWSEHWAFVPPAEHPVPIVKDTAWAKSTVDHFILARLEAVGISPTPEAEPALLLRRVSLDLIGLPPTLAELDAFEAAFKEKPDAAYAAEVERLLASPHFGERWATTWLDLARFADTEGLGLDRPRTAWPFRDWVVRAFNEDMPFDQFTIKQLAGDLLPDATVDDLIATNFHRQTQANAEGGTDDEEFRVTAVMDRVATTWEAWQGVTMGCVQCHSHPYDPIQHEEYYTSLAFFNNTRDSDLDGHFPVIPVPKDPAQAADFSRLLRERAELRLESHQAYEALRTKTTWLPVESLAATSKQVKLETSPELAELRTVGTVPGNSVFEISFKPAPEQSSLSAFRIELLPQNETEAIHTPEWGSVLSQIHLLGPDGQAIELAAVIPDEPEPFLNPNDSLRDNSSGWGPYTKIDRPRSCVVILREPLEVTADTMLGLRLHHNQIGGGSFPLVTKRARIALSADDHWTELLTDEANHARNARIADINGALAKGSAANLPVLQEQPEGHRRPTHLFIRGNWLEKDAATRSPDIPRLFGTLPADAPKDRLALAKWLVSAENPLTARVAVNRFWEQLFGTGLVETLEDFGSSGTKPSHPELLDWLALRFRGELAWSTKAMLRELVLSATYRQSSAAPARNREVDPTNRLISRGPRNRLSAEAVRDHGLVASGMFVPKLGGPPVFPPMPPGGWTPFKSGEKWATPEPGQPDRYRRAIYTYTKRSNPYPGFATFDAPPRDLCTKRRVLSNTPLQSLETLNGPAFAEFAQGLARRMKNEFPGDLAAKIAAGHRATTSRNPDSERLAKLVELFQELEAQYIAEPDLKTGMAGTPDGAAFTVVASVLLNLDDALTK
jgi:hypothetical protein